MRPKFMWTPDDDKKNKQLLFEVNHYDRPRLGL
jgi:hypothetical protein